MNKKRIGAYLLAVLLLAMLFAVPSVGIADAGFFSGGDDYGDWGGSDWSDSDWGDSDWDDSWGSGSTYYYDDGDYGGGGGMGSFAVVVLVIIVIAVIGSMRRRGGSRTGSRTVGSRTGAGRPVNPGAQRTTLPMTVADLKARDPNFSEEAMEEKIGNLYIRMQECWQNKEWEEMRGSMTDALYNQMGRQLDTLVRNRQTNYVERIAVLGVDLTGFGQDEKNDILTALVRTRIVDYTVSDETGALVSGSKTAEKFLTYEWTLIRTKGAGTVKADSDETAHCPNCGAPIDINHTAKCEYCGGVITAAEYDWVISAIKGISQRTGN